MSLGSLWEFLWKDLRSFIFSGHCAKILWIAAKKFWHCCRKCLLRVHRNKLKIFFSKKMPLINTGHCVKNVQLLSKFFWQGCRNCLLCDYSIILSEKFFERKCFLQIFRTSIETFTASCGNFLAWFSKLQPTCRREFLGRKSLFESGYTIFLSFSKLERKKMVT